LLLSGFFNLLRQVIIFKINFVLFVPFCALPSMPFSSAFRAACCLAIFLSHIRHKPLSANAAGTFFTKIAGHNCNSPGLKSEEKISVKFQFKNLLRDIGGIAGYDLLDNLRGIAAGFFLLHYFVSASGTMRYII